METSEIGSNGNQSDSIDPDLLATEQDPLLTLLVKMANTADLELSITLTVGGLLVSGMLVGGRTYYRGLAEQFRSVTGDFKSVADTFAVQLDEAAVTIYGSSPFETSVNHVGEDKQSEASDDQSDSEQWRIGHIHLKNAQLIQPGSAPAAVPWWRGRLSAVDGFTLGQLQHR